MGKRLWSIALLQEWLAAGAASVVEGDTEAGRGARRHWRRRAPGGVGRVKGEEGRREPIWRGGGEATGPAADPGPPKSKFTIVCCSPRLRYSFSAYPFLVSPPYLLSLSLSLRLSTFHTSLSSRFVRSSLPDRVFPFLPLLCLFPSFLFFSFLFFPSFFPSSPSSFLLFCFARSLESGAGTSRDKRRAPDNGKKWRGSTRSFRIAALCHGW